MPTWVANIAIHILQIEKIFPTVYISQILLYKYIKYYVNNKDIANIMIFSSNIANITSTIKILQILCILFFKYMKYYVNIRDIANIMYFVLWIHQILRQY